MTSISDSRRQRRHGVWVVGIPLRVAHRAPHHHGDAQRGDHLLAHAPGRVQEDVVHIAAAEHLRTRLNNWYMYICIYS